jgi:hypothetical protein
VIFSLLLVVVVVDMIVAVVAVPADIFILVLLV